MKQVEKDREKILRNYRKPTKRSYENLDRQNEHYSENQFREPFEKRDFNGDQYILYDVRCKTIIILIMIHS